jgi:hypothetical protein
MLTVSTNELVLRPAAVLAADQAERVLAALASADVSRGGVWNASHGVWQRYDRPWNGPGGMRGDAELVGSVAVTHDQPRRGELAIYKCSLTPHGLALRISAESICDEALAVAGARIATCPRQGEDPSALSVPAQRSAREILRTNLGELRKSDLRALLTTDVREIVRPA